MLDPVIRKAAQIMRTVECDSEYMDGYDRAGYYYNLCISEDGRWYIIVKHPNGGALYDGWWECGKSLAEAVQEAVRGAGLVNERAARPLQGGAKP